MAISALLQSLAAVVVLVVLLIVVKVVSFVFVSAAATAVPCSGGWGPPSSIMVGGDGRMAYVLLLTWSDALFE